MNDLTTMFTDLFSAAPISYLIGIVLVIIFLAKKLIKWAIIFAVLMFFVLPYLDEQGYLDSVKGLFN
jgi:uncharacterized membrane protein